MSREITAFAAQIAREAGEILRRVRETGVSIEKKGSRDLVTTADRESERFLKAAILERFPDHRFLAEESAPSLERAFDFSGPVWIIDPVDGTTNYAHGHHNVGVSIAYAVDGKVHGAVVHCPFLDETFEATRGGGAYLNGRKISVSQTNQLSEALVGTGFPYKREIMDQVITNLRNILPRCRDIRRVGAASQDICWVACGRLDGFYESVFPWDMAAAGLVAREAGAITGNFGNVEQTAWPEELRAVNFATATPGVFQELLQVLT